MICTTILIRDRKPILSSLHLFRLQKQAEALRIPILSDINQVLKDYIQRQKEESFGLRIELSPEGMIRLVARALPQQLGTVGLCRREEIAQIPWIKYADRAGWNRQKNMLDVKHLLFYENDEILEFSEGNIFIWYQNQLHTPPTEKNILPGTMRATVMVIAQALGHPVREQKCRLELLKEPATLCFSSALRGIRTINGEEIDIVSRIQDFFGNQAWLERHEQQILENFQNSFPDIA